MRRGWLRFYPLLLVLSGFQAGCGDDASSGDALVDLAFEELTGDGERDPRWLIPGDLFEVEGLERLASRLPDDSQGFTSSTTIKTPPSEGSVDWKLLEMVPAEHVVLAALHGSDPDAPFDWLLEAMIPGVSHIFATNQELLLDQVSPPSWDKSAESFLNRNLKASGSPIDELRRTWGERARGDVLILLSRIADVFDRVEYAEFYSAGPGPTLARTLVLPLAEDVPLQDVNEELMQLVSALGFAEPETATHEGVPYVRLSLKVPILEFAHVRPAWAVIDERLLVSSYEPKLLATLDTNRDPKAHPPLSSRDAVRAATSVSPEDTQRVLFADLQRLCAAPEDLEIGRGPRGWHWDRRNVWVNDNWDQRQAGIAHREKLESEHRENHGRPPNVGELVAIDDAVVAFMEAEYRRYPEHVEAYRQQLRKLSRLRFFTLVQSRVDDQLRTDVTIRLGEN